MNGPSYDYPKAADEKEKCIDFLRNFLVGDYRKYMDQLQEISNRQRKVLELSIDDVFDYRNDEEFTDNIKSNTIRYMRYFELAADSLLPAESVQRGEKDVFDILQVGQLIRHMLGRNVPHHTQLRE